MNVEVNSNIFQIAEIMVLLSKSVLHISNIWFISVLYKCFEEIVSTFKMKLTPWFNKIYFLSINKNNNVIVTGSVFVTSTLAIKSSTTPTFSNITITIIIFTVFNGYHFITYNCFTIYPPRYIFYTSAPMQQCLSSKSLCESWYSLKNLL